MLTQTIFTRDSDSITFGMPLTADEIERGLQVLRTTEARVAGVPKKLASPKSAYSREWDANQRAAARMVGGDKWFPR